MSTPAQQQPFVPVNPVRSGIPLGGLVAEAAEFKETTPVRVSVVGASANLTALVAQRVAMAAKYAYVPDCFTEELTARGYRSSRDVPEERLVSFQEGILQRQVDLFARSAQSAQGVVFHGGPVEVLAFSLRNYSRVDACRGDLPRLRETATRIQWLYDVTVIVPWDGLDRRAAQGTPTDGDLLLKHCLLTGVAIELAQRIAQTSPSSATLVPLDFTVADREQWVLQVLGAIDELRRRRYASALSGPKPSVRPPSPDLTREGVERDRQGLGDVR